MDKAPDPAFTRTPILADLAYVPRNSKNKGPPFGAALREALPHYNLTPDKDVIIVQTGGEGERLAALATKALDGAMLSGDQRFQAEKLGFHVVIDLSKLPIEYPNNGIVVRKDFVRTNRDTVKRFLKAPSSV